jgi:cytoskeletal protein RodZ
LPSLLYRIVREDPVAPHRLNPSLGFQVEAVLKKGLSKNATDRYDTSVEFVEALAAACAASPGWHPLPRSSAQTLPTMAGPVVDRKPVERPVAPAREAQPTRAPERSTPPFSQTHGPEATNPLLRSLVWMLVGIGLVGLVLFGAQKFLFNRNTEPPAGTQTQAQSQQPANQTPDISASKPSPVGQPIVPEQAAKQTSPPETPSETTSPENSEPAKSKPSAPQETRPAQQPSIPPPVTASKEGPQQSVQFLTDPPGAQVTVDGNSSQACKTPCIMQLSPGRHALSADLSSYRAYPRVFNVPQDSDIFLQLSKASGTLSVTSNPAGAAIEIDGQMQSKRTPAVFNFAPGNYHVKVSRSGAFLDFDVQIHDGEFVNKRVDF